jgi:hypothetical protein
MNAPVSTRHAARYHVAPMQHVPTRRTDDAAHATCAARRIVRIELRRSLRILLAATACALPADRDTASDTAELESWQSPDGSSGAPSGGSRDPELPRVLINTQYVPPTGTTRTVRAAENLQAVLDAARPGDVILLEAGASFVGNFTLPAKTGSGWIVIRSSTPDANLPPAGTRINPSFAPALPKIVSPNTNAALRTAAGAHHYRLIGVEATAASSVTQNSCIVLLGDGGQRSLDQVPHDIILDRTYVHGHATLNLKCCVGLNSAMSAVIDSYLADCHAKGFDSQAIGGYSGPGPFKIVNNYLEGAGENVMFGGGDPSIRNLTPSDIEIRRNHFTRPVSWKGVWTVKNLFELKHAQRVLVEGNVFENHWAEAQSGSAIVWKSVNQYGTAPWSVVRDVTFRHNRLRNVSGGIVLAARPEAHPAVPASRVKIVDNVFDNVNVGPFTGHGALFALGNGPEDVTIEHNTALHGAAGHSALAIDVAPPQMARLVFRDNVLTRGQYGIFGSGAGEGLSALTFYAAPDFKFERNVLIGPDNRAVYPANNSFPATIAAVGFVNAAAGNYRLRAGTPYKKAGSDGRDPGADIDAVDSATQGVAAPR